MLVKAGRLNQASITYLLKTVTDQAPGCDFARRPAVTCRVWKLRLDNGDYCVMHSPDYITKETFKQRLPGLFIGRRVRAIKGLYWVTFD